MRTPTLAAAHKGRYRDPSIVVFCRDGDPGGSPEQYKHYRSVAEEFAAGRTIEDWNDSGWFRIGEKNYQITADRECIDIIERRSVL